MHDEPLAKELVQSPTAPFTGSEDASHGFGEHVALVSTLSVHDVVRKIFVVVTQHAAAVTVAQHEAEALLWRWAWRAGAGAVAALAECPRTRSFVAHHRGRKTTTA